jgi:hypothetical protein
MTTESIATSWRTAWREPSFRVRALITIPILFAALAALSQFLERVEQRPGVVLPDPLLSLFTPVDVTWLTFALIYVGLFAAVGSLLRHPHRLLFAFQAYVIMAVFRIIGMTLVPLDAPATLIPLKDPFVEFFGSGQVLTRDLFFSGHTSTLFLFFLVTPRGTLKTLFLVCTVVVAAAVLVQHVHYAIDVFVAPFFSYAAVKIAGRLNHGLPIDDDVQSVPLRHRGAP